MNHDGLVDPTWCTFLHKIFNVANSEPESLAFLQHESRAEDTMELRGCMVAAEDLDGSVCRHLSLTLV